MENYHHMHSQLARLKVTPLENLKKEAKYRYNEALRAYVIKYFGRPLEKLNVRNGISCSYNCLIKCHFSTAIFRWRSK